MSTLWAWTSLAELSTSTVQSVVEVVIVLGENFLNTFNPTPEQCSGMELPYLGVVFAEKDNDFIAGIKTLGIHWSATLLVETIFIREMI